MAIVIAPVAVYDLEVYCALPQCALPLAVQPKIQDYSSLHSSPPPMNLLRCSFAELSKVLPYLSRITLIILTFHSEQGLSRRGHMVVAVLVLPTHHPMFLCLVRELQPQSDLKQVLKTTI